jgi:hypothetical protein
VSARWYSPRNAKPRSVPLSPGRPGEHPTTKVADAQEARLYLGRRVPGKFTPEALLPPRCDMNPNKRAFDRHARFFAGCYFLIASACATSCLCRHLGHDHLAAAAEAAEGVGYTLCFWGYWRTLRRVVH